jgi:hypothetical protein
MRQLRLASLLVFTCCLFLCGCGAKTATVKGTLALPPEVKVAKDDSVSIGFVPEVKGPTVSATFNPSDNSFIAQNLPAGKYKVAVSISPYMGAPGTEKRAEWLQTNLNAVFDAAMTPLKVDVPAGGEKTVTIDLAAKAVK